MTPYSCYKDAFELLEQCAQHQDQQGVNQALDKLSGENIPGVLSALLLQVVNTVRNHFENAVFYSSGLDPFEKTPLLEYAVKAINQKYGPDCLMNLPQLRCSPHISMSIAELAKILFENSQHRMNYHISTDLQTSLIKLLNNNGFDPNTPVHDEYKQFLEPQFSVNFLSYVVSHQPSNFDTNNNEEFCSLINELQLKGAILDLRVISGFKDLRSRQMSSFIKGSRGLYERLKPLLLSQPVGSHSLSILPHEIIKEICLHVIQQYIK